MDNSTTIAAAEAGDKNAQYNLGRILHRDQNYVEAMKWFQAAAKQTHAEAATNVGNILMCNLHMSESERCDNAPDYIEVMRWFQEGARQGCCEAQFHLGNMYLDGKGAPQDHAEGVRWLQMSANKGWVRH